MNTTKTSTYIIELNEIEAKTLKALIQNAQHPNEAAEFREFRERLFNQLTELGVDFS